MDDVALLVIGNGRLDYLHDTVDCALDMLPQFEHYLMIDDSGDIAVRRELDRTYPDFLIHHNDRNLGMAKAVQAGFDMVLSTDARYVFHLEEDFRILRPPPVADAIAYLDITPHVAQMLFQRQPLNDAEVAAGSVVGAMDATYAGGAVWLQRHIFSLNPCIIPRHILEYGWPSGPLGVGNEAGMTKKLLDAGYWFGVWDGQYVEHVGTGRGKQWQL